MQPTRSSRPSRFQALKHRLRRLSTPRHLFILALGLGLGLSGCRTIDEDWDKPVGEAFVPTNFYQKGPIPASVRRVAVLPLYSKEWDHVDLNAMQQTFASELGQREEFEVVVVLPDRVQQIFGNDQVSSVEAISKDQFTTLVQATGADAILFTDLTSFYPYRPIVMGVRCKLVESKTAEILWAFDTVFDSGNPTVSTAARRFHSDESAPPYPLQNSSSILQSPLRYSKYVADAAFATIPDR